MAHERYRGQIGSISFQPPSNLAVSDVGSDGFTVSWTSNDPYTIFTFIFVDGEIWDLVMGVTHYDFEELDPATEYTVGVCECIVTVESVPTITATTEAGD